MAVSHSDIQHFNAKSNHRGREPVTNETGVTNINSPAWPKDVKTTHDSFWPQFPPPHGLPPAEKDNWSLYSQNVCNSPKAITVLSASWPNHLPVSFTQSRDMQTEHDKLDEGDTKTADPSVQSLTDAPTSRPRSPSLHQRPVVADCKPADNEGLPCSTVLPGTRSPTVGSESLSSKSDNSTGRSLEHLTVLHNTGLMDRPTFHPVLSRSFGASCVGDIGGGIGLPSKRALSAYYGVQTSLKQHLIDADEHCGALWSQQQMCSKSAPQHLHGMDLPATHAPSPMDAGPSCSVPDSGHPSLGPLDPLRAFDAPASGHIEQSFDTQQSAPITSSLVTANEEERGLHQPDGADHPDEHMWLYEDPQGRTQGSFSDAQMHDWLSEGIYFTEALRVRRKCDDTFSTLAQYCQLFGRIPFYSGPRIPPIIGGITPHTLAGTGGPAYRFCQARAGAIGSVGSSCAAPSLGPPGGYLLSPPPPLSSPSSAAGHRSLYKVDPEPSVHLPNRCGFGSSITEEDRPAANKLTSGLYFNSSPPVGPNRFLPFPQTRPPPPPPPLVPHDLAASSLSPGFLSALAPYLTPMSGQVGLGTASSPVVSGTASGSPVSSMQQLAETAQLAAQLAAMASVHSPDQTPMQPSQALALAEMLISTHLSPTNWSQLKKDGPFGTTGELCAEQTGTAAMTAGNEGPRMHSGIHPQGGGFSDDVVMKQPSLLITGSTSGTLGASDNCATVDGDRKVSTNASRETIGNAYSKQQQQQRSAEASRNNPTGQPFKSQQGKAVHSGNNAGGDCNHTSTAATPGAYTRREGQMTFPDSLQRPPNPPQSTSKWLAAVGVGDSHSSSADHPQAAQKVPTASKSHASGGRGAGADTEPKKRSSNKTAGCKDDRQHTVVNGPCRVGPCSTPVKDTANHGKPGFAATPQAQCAVDKLQSPLKSQTNSQSDSSAAVTSAQAMKQLSESAEVELGLLTQWSIGRLSSLSMREKVDIPTVVELLATLDAPYEVERMVSTFLGESARATQFVKDFLDHRRPFWKLHRQLRENSIVVVGQPPNLTANHVTCVGAGHQGTSAAGTTSRSSERASAVANSAATATNSSGTASSTTNNSKKKKRPGAASGSGGGGSLATGSANHVLHHQSSGASGDSSADNQWHHIKPKSSLHRKTNNNNKVGDRKPVPS